MTLLTDLDHRPCGELDTGVEAPVVCVDCECGARIARQMQMVEEDTR